VQADHRTFHSNMSAIKTLNPKAEVARAAQVRWLTWECEARQTCTKRIRRFVSLLQATRVPQLPPGAEGGCRGGGNLTTTPTLAPGHYVVWPSRRSARAPISYTLLLVIALLSVVVVSWCRLQRTERVRAAKGVPPSLRAFQRLTHALHTCHSPVRVCAHMLVCGRASAHGRASLGPWPHRGMFPHLSHFVRSVVRFVCTCKL
jgi:hypothetical protein